MAYARKVEHAPAKYGIRPPNAARRQNYGLCAEKVKAPAFAIVAERTHHAPSIFQQGHDGVFHKDVQAQVYPVILQGADHFETRTVAHVGKSRIAMPAKIALQNPPIRGAIEEGSP